ncbi:glycoside hydrolase family 16 protein [Polychaeton citri CBS 116435]|uniref:Glycoside hydrolase family 16 protein n=1 Tax=Polychaeton citri CBS 116435 TaxID=1314669 RepID=A0A9P4PZK0_9PEZI|nr:glycoside hydrolase family 16 protein [Polychaeton citri CBS 116435]
MFVAVGYIPVVLASVIAIATAQNASTTPDNGNLTTTPSPASTNCACGFYDPRNDRYYTDSLIVYFNETHAIPDDSFKVDTFTHHYEKGWAITYREGASASNIAYENGSTWNIDGGWLNLNVSGYDNQHLVNGAQLQSLRQDIQYGSFRVLMKSPGAWAGGTAMVMKLEHNETSSAELDLMNMDDSTNMAWVATTTANQEPQFSNGVNYTVLENDTLHLGPWDFLEYRMDWDEDTVDWYADTFLVHSTSTEDAGLWNVSTAAYFKHWSNGDADWMQGPPQNEVNAAIGWVRYFFNSSLPAANPDAMSGCSLADRCSTEDETLRYSTPTTPEMQHKPLLAMEEKKPWSADPAAVGLMAASVAFTAALLLHLLFRKLFVRDKSPRLRADVELSKLRPGASSATLLDADHKSPAFLDARLRSNSSRPLLGQSQSPNISTTTLGLTSGVSTPNRLSAFERSDPNGTDQIEPSANKVVYSPAISGTATPNPDLASFTGQKAATVAATEAQAEGAVAAANPGAKPPPMAPVRNRVDYLAGLVALCSLLVSCTHFILTFVPSVIMEYLPRHYDSELWARKTIEPFFFNEIWVGIFFTTSTRFLTTAYLRNGSLKGLAEKVVCRTPRLMIPITAVILFEYFLLDCGATKWLEYIPSVTWTTWVNTSVYPNFGWFINATLEVIYLIPNAAPQITWYYATGVLWTIPVQLQNSWLVLLGVVIIREINTPWKRFGYYGFCIINHWYALSWGSYFWFGLLLADLDITYKYRKSVQSTPVAHYPMLILAIILVLLSLANDLFSYHFGYTFSTEERGIHPDLYTGLPLSRTANAGYPSYTEPKLNGLVFCVCAQYIVELSTWAQKFLSTKPFLLLFPHVFTIYLIHGLVFWSIGSLVCVYFASQNLAYWLNMLLTAIICYVVLFAVLPIVTPVMEMLGKEITKSIWVGASEEPAVWRPTAWPFIAEEIIVSELDEREERKHGSDAVK